MLIDKKSEIRREMNMLEGKYFSKKSDLGKVLRLSVMTAIILGFMVLVPMAAQAESSNPNPDVLPVNSNSYGMTYGEWSARWWQWALSMPVDKNPLLDTADCSKGQSGKVWFLAGTFGGSVERKCTMPAEKAILFPIINAEWSVVEANSIDGKCFLPDVISGTTEEALRACAKAQIDHVTIKEASVDGVQLQDLDNYRVESPLFEFTLPKNNILGLPAGSSPSVSDGYWILLAPLPVGKHTVHFRGVAVFPNPKPKKPPFVFETEVTYSLSVR